MYPLPPRIGKVAARQRPLVECGSIISIAFMLSKAETSGGRWQCCDSYSIHVQSNLPKIGRQGTLSPGLKFVLNMNAIELFFYSIHV